MRIFSYLFMLLLILFGVSFAILNAEPVLINFYIGTQTLPLSLLLVLALFFGVALGLIVSLFLSIKYSSSNAKLRHRLKLAEAEISNLRAIPVKNEH